MISGSVFSTADLGNPQRHLYGKVKVNGEVKEVELLYENEETGLTEVRFRDGGMDEVKTKKIYDLQDFKKSQW